MTAPDLASFVKARISEEEAAARATAVDYPPPWRGPELDEDGDSIDLDIVYDASSLTGRTVVYWESGTRQSATRLGVHIARHDPARVLADCATKRAIVDLLERYEQAIRADRFGADPGDPVWPTELCAARDALWAAVRLLAQPDAGHTDFNPAWAVAD